MTMTERWQLRPRARVDDDTQTEGARVLLDTYSATLYDCNETAWVLLEALAGGTTVDDLVDRITDTFDISVEDARRDAERFVYQLHQMGLADGHA